MRMMQRDIVNLCVQEVTLQIQELINVSKSVILKIFILMFHQETNVYPNVYKQEWLYLETQQLKNV